MIKLTCFKYFLGFLCLYLINFKNDKGTKDFKNVKDDKIFKKYIWV